MQTLEYFVMRCSDPGEVEAAAILPRVFWTAASLLESNYGHEFAMALNLMIKVRERFRVELF